MVVICFVLGVLVYGGGRYSFGIFMKPLAETMGWSRTEISFAVTLHLLCYGVSSPLIGWMLDTMGARKVMIAGGLLMAASMCAMYFANSLWMFYFLYGILSAIGANAVGRISQASIVANWFVKRRGLMMGITAISIGLGTSIMAPVVRLFLDTYGWQQAFVAMGLMMFVLVVLPIVFFVKGHGRPEDRGFGPDGVPLTQAQPSSLSDSDNNNPPALSPAVSNDWKLAEVLCSKSFWAITIAVGICFMADYVVLLHGPAAFEDRGHSGATAAFLLSMVTLASCFGRFGFGWLADRIDLKLGFVLMFGIQILAMPLVILDSGIYMLYAFALVWGIGYGGASVYLPYALAEYFGRSNFSSVYGWSLMIISFCGSLGGVVGGMVYDTYKSYDFAWIGCAIVWALALLIVLLFGGKPKPRMENTGLSERQVVA